MPRTRKELSDLISTTRSTLEQCESACNEKKLEITKLQIKKIEAETLVKDFQNNNVKYLQMKHTVKREVENAFANRRQLLRFALLSLIESLRKEPRKFHILYYNMSSTKTSGTPSTALPTTGYYYGHYNNIPFKNEQSLSPDYYTNSEETYEKILLDESEELYNKMVEDLANKTISDVAILSQSLSPLSLLPRSDDDEEK
jgi:hypothetical protein